MPTRIMRAPRRRHSDTDDEGVQPAALQGYRLAIFGGTKALSVALGPGASPWRRKPWPGSAFRETMSFAERGWVWLTLNSILLGSAATPTCEPAASSLP